MTDVLKIALERRSKLQAEVDELNEFIRTAEGLIRASGDPAPVKAPAAEVEESPMQAAARRLTDAEPRPAPEPAAAEATDVPRPSIIRRGLAG